MGPTLVAEIVLSVLVAFSLGFPLFSVASPRHMCRKLLPCGKDRRVVGIRSASKLR